MMIGEIGYRETLIDTLGSGLLPLPALSFVIFAIFVVTMAILLANLLVRVLVPTISTINETYMGLIFDQISYICIKCHLCLQHLDLIRISLIVAVPLR
jgi:hypothetical protein